MPSASAAPDAFKFPEDFTEFLERSGLPVPPLPLSLFNTIDEVGPDFFASDARMTPVRLSTTSDLEGFLDAFHRKDSASKKDDWLRYAGFGLAGYGMQSRQVQLIVDSGGLRFAAALPWNNAFDAPDAERAQLRAAYAVLEAALARIPEKGLLTVMISQEGIFWSACTDEDAVEGDSLAALLDLLDEESPTTPHASASGLEPSAQIDSPFEFPPPNAWLRV